MSSSDNGYRALNVFEGTSSLWPSFLLKFRGVVDTKDMLYLIDRKDDLVAPTDTKEVRLQREDEALRRPKEDKVVKSLLMNKLTEDVLANISDLGTSYEMMQKLTSIYDSQSTASAMMRMDRLLDRKLQPGYPFTKLLGDINGDIQAIKRSGTFDFDKLHVIALLRAAGSHSDFHGVVNSLKIMDESALTKEKVIHVLSERALELAGQPGTATVNASSRKNAFETTHHQGGTAKEKICFNCGVAGHIKSECWKEGGGAAGKGPKQQKQRKKSANQVEKSKQDNLWAFSTTQVPKVAMASTANDGLDTNSWIRDSGSGHHYCRNRDLFRNYVPVDGEEVRVASGQALKIHGKGSILFEARQANGGTQEVMLKEVFYVPDMAVNLVSTAQLDRVGLEERTRNGIARYLMNGTEVFHSRLDGERWSMQWRPIAPVQRDCNLAVTEKVWHERMGHISRPALRKLKTMVSGIEYVEEKDPIKCDTCIMGKMKNLPHPPTNHKKAKNPLDLLHLDWIIVNTKGTKGETVALIGTDDCTDMKFVWPEISRSGETVKKIFKSWLPWAERMTGRTLKAVRHDKAQEFVHGVFADYLADLGVEVQCSVAYEHQQNGKAENTNRVIMDKARCMLIQSQLPDRYWPYAITAAGFIGNRSPVVGQPKVPYELFTGREPDMDTIHTFGSKCYSLIPSELRKGNKKLQPRAKEGTFLGYTNGGTAYLVLDSASNQVVEAVSVLFEDRVTGKGAKIVGGPLRLDFDDPDDSDDALAVVSSEAVSSNVVQVEAVSDQAVEPDRLVVEVPGEEALDDVYKDVSDNWSMAGNVPLSPPASRPTRVRVPITRYGHYAFLTIHGGQWALATVPLNVAMKDKEAWPAWQAAQRKQLETLAKYKTWELVPLPAGSKAARSIWVLAENNGPKGNIKKARIVYDGSQAIKGVDYNETYSPVCKPETVKIVLVIANALGLRIKQADVEAAYLNGATTEDVYMQQPPGYEVQGKDGTKLVCKLLKALYGTKDAGRIWNKTIDAVLTGQGFRRSTFDRCMYFAGSIETKDLTIICLIVDDFIIAHFDGNKFMLALWSALDAKFVMQDLGEVSKFVGVSIGRDIKSRVLTMSQEPALRSVVAEYGIGPQEKRATPMQAKMVLYPKVDSELATTKPYRGVIGSLMHPMIWTRPDLAFSVSTLGQFCSNPTETHWQAAEDVLRYVNQTATLGIAYTCGDESSRFKIKVYADSDWASDMLTGKSCFGYVVYLGGNPISWKSKKSSSVKTSSTTAEIEGCYHAAVEGIWVHNLLTELGINPGVIEVYQDNEAVVKILMGERNVERTKHEMVKIEFLRELVAAGRIKIIKVGTERQTSDVFTKSLAGPKFKEFIGDLKMRDITSQGTNEAVCQYSMKEQAAATIKKVQFKHD